MKQMIDTVTIEKIDPALAEWFFRLTPPEQSALLSEAADELANLEDESQFTFWQFKVSDYLKTFLHWSPWSGSPDKPGQQEVIDAYTLALRQQHERDAYEQGEMALGDLEYWRPGEVIKNRIRVEAGHTVGKTKLAAGLVSHFFDCFPPSIVYCFAPGYDQINDLLFKEIRMDREGKRLSGRVLETPEIKYRGNHFVKGRATNDANKRGTERIQGQHGKYLMFILDEAEGIADFVWDAVDSMASGGIVIVLMLANPRTRTSKFYKARIRPSVKSFRISCLSHPNVLEDREVIPGAVRRDYVIEMLQHCEVVPEHDPDYHTFELPWQPGIIYQPNAEYLFRVLGIAPANLSDNTFCPVGRYEAATRRKPFDGDDPTKARIGIDCARYGNDMGTIYQRHAGAVKRLNQISKQDGFEYYIKAKEAAERLAAIGVTDIQFRIDAGGGYGSTCIDTLKRDSDLKVKFEKFHVFEVHNNGVPYTAKDFADMVTEMYYCASEALKQLALINPPEFLETDLTERAYKYVTKSAAAVKQLTPKERFKDQFGRSPDDGDGYVLCAAPDYLFRQGVFVG